MATRTGSAATSAAHEIERELRDEGIALLVPIAAAAAVLGVSRRTAARLVATGDLPTIRASGAGSSRVMVRRSALAAYLAARERRATPARA